MNPTAHGRRSETTAAGNLFVIFGEPISAITDAATGWYRCRFSAWTCSSPRPARCRARAPTASRSGCSTPTTTKSRSSSAHAYFLGANDPYKALKTTLKAEIDEEAWESLYSDTSRPFAKPKSGRIAVKVINHLGDEVMKVFAVE